MAKKKSVSDSRLSTLWSKAVIAKYKSCPISGSVDGLQAHHIIAKGRQRRFALRWDIRNGVPLSVAAHRAYHDGDLDINMRLLDHVSQRRDIEYLQDLKYQLKPDFLQALGMTDNEYRLAKKAELEAIINDAE